MARVENELDSIQNYVMLHPHNGALRWHIHAEKLG